MNELANLSGFNFSALKIIIAATLASTSIAWWIWITHCSLGQLRANQIGFIDLLFECFRSLCVVLVILTIISFL